ncbi:hypothetical protein GCM10027262_34410 [Nocardia tengchongensis]
MVSGPAAIRIGTMLDSMPVERRMTAVVRAATGRLSTASSWPVSRAIYAAKAAMTTPARPESRCAPHASARFSRSSDSTTPTRVLSDRAGAVRPLIEVALSRPAVRSSQCARSVRNRLLSR